MRNTSYEPTPFSHGGPDRRNEETVCRCTSNLRFTCSPTQGEPMTNSPAFECVACRSRQRKFVAFRRHTLVAHTSEMFDFPEIPNDTTTRFAENVVEVLAFVPCQVAPK